MITLREDPMLMMVAALGKPMSGRSTGSAIEESESRGQARLALLSKTAEALLPTDMRDARPALEKAGVRFLGTVDGDPMFQRVTLPPGWEIKRTDHNMYTNLCDEKGRVRASIFYKAAFYDRSARLSMERRYQIKSFYNTDHQSVAVARVEDQGAVLFESERFPLLNDADRYGVMDKTTYKEVTPPKRDVADGQCRAWLAENFPNWGDVTSYWD